MAKPAHHKTRSSALHPWRLLGLVGLGVAALVVVDGGALAADRASAPRPTTADVAAALAFGDAPTGPCWTPSTPPKLTIVTVVDGWPRLAAAALRRNKAAYAATHGYRYCEFGRLDLGRPLSWSKFPAMKEALKFSEWAFWIDADAIFRDLATPLLPLVETLARPSNAEAVYSGEVRGDPWELHQDRWINAGAFAMKRTPWVASLLDRLHGYGARDQPGGPSASDQWAANRFREDAAFKDAFARKAVVVPNGHFNALGQRGDDAFVAHFAGLPKVPAALDLLADEARRAERGGADGAPGALLTIHATGDGCPSDKGLDVGDRHGYTLLYDRLFRDLRRRRASILELGLEGHGAPGAGASRDRDTGVGEPPSMCLWRNFAGEARGRPGWRRAGADISDFSRNARAHGFDFYRFDAGDAASYGAMKGERYDVIIDDGSHASLHQQTALAELWGALKPGGLFVVEDLQWQPPADRIPEPVPKTASILERNLVVDAAHPHAAAFAVIKDELARPPAVFYESYFKAGGRPDVPKIAVLVKAGPGAAAALDKLPLGAATK